MRVLLRLAVVPRGSFGSSRPDRDRGRGKELHLRVGRGLQLCRIHEDRPALAAAGHNRSRGRRRASRRALSGCHGPDVHPRATGLPEELLQPVGEGRACLGRFRQLCRTRDRCRASPLDAERPRLRTCPRCLCRRVRGGPPSYLDIRGLSRLVRGLSARCRAAVRA